MSGFFSGSGVSDLIGLGDPPPTPTTTFQQHLAAQQAGAYKAAQGGKVSCAAHGGKQHDANCPDCLKVENDDLHQKNMSLAKALEGSLPKAGFGGVIGEAFSGLSSGNIAKAYTGSGGGTARQIGGDTFYGGGNPTAVKKADTGAIDKTSATLAANAAKAGAIADDARANPQAAPKATTATKAKAGTATAAAQAKTRDTASVNAAAPKEAAVTNAADTRVGPVTNAQAAAGPQVTNAQAAAGPQITNAQGTVLNQGQTSNIEAKQLALADLLGQQSTGAAPSLSGLQLKQANDRAIAAQRSMAASTGGSNAALANRNAAVQTSNLMQGNAAQAAQTAIQQQQVNQALQANVLGTSGSQAGQVAATQAGLTQGTSLANAAAANQGALQTSAQQQQTALANAQAANVAAGQGSAQEQAAALANAQAANTLTAQQAGLTQGTTLANAAAANQAAGQAYQGQLSVAQQNAAQGTQVNLSNAAATNAAALQSAAAQTGVSQSNAANVTQVNLANMGAEQQTALANQAAELAATGLNNAQIAAMMGIEQADLNSVLAAQSGIYSSQTGANIASQQAGTSLFGGIAGGLGSLGAGIFGNAGGKAAEGGIIPGTPAKEDGDYSKDKHPVLVQPGEIIVPVESAKSGDKAKKFVDAINKAGAGGSIEARNGHASLKAAEGGVSIAGLPPTRSASDIADYYINKSMGLANAIKGSFGNPMPPKQPEGGLSPLMQKGMEKLGAKIGGKLDTWMNTPSITDMTPGGFTGPDFGPAALDPAATGIPAGPEAISGEVGTEIAGQAAGETLASEVASTAATEAASAAAAEAATAAAAEAATAAATEAATAAATEGGGEAILAALAAKGGKMVCTNPSCPSAGSSHPNCKCSPKAAKGGKMATSKKKEYDKKLADAIRMMRGK